MDLLDAFELGEDVKYIRFQAILGGYIRRKEGMYILDTLKEMHTLLKEAEIAENIVKHLSDWITKLEKSYPKAEAAISKKDANALEKEVDSWKKEIRRELERKPVIAIELQSGLNPNELTKVAEQKPSEFIPSEIWEKMTDIEKNDLSDAAKCLLLGTATPSVMVALRGAEASIRNFYHNKTKMEPCEKTWRQLTQELKEKAKDLGIKDTFIGYLDYIGDAKRNFAQHPNKIYSLREAVMIFMQVASLIEDIYLQI